MASSLNMDLTDFRISDDLYVIVNGTTSTYPAKSPEDLRKYGYLR